MLLFKEHLKITSIEVINMPKVKGKRETVSLTEQVGL